MKRIGKLVIMTEHEYISFDWLNNDIQNEVKFWHEEAAKWDMERESRRAERKRAYQAGVFHASGGYAKALKDLRARLAGTTATMCRAFDLLAKWRPLVEALETYPNQFIEIGFEQGLHFPVECVDGQGKHYLKTVSYERVSALPLVAQSDPFAQADFAAVGAEVAKEQP